MPISTAPTHDVMPAAAGMTVGTLALVFWANLLCERALTRAGQVRWHNRVELMSLCGA